MYCIQLGGRWIRWCDRTNQLKYEGYLAKETYAPLFVVVLQMHSCVSFQPYDALATSSLQKNAKVVYCFSKSKTADGFHFATCQYYVDTERREDFERAWSRHQKWTETVVGGGDDQSEGGSVASGQPVKPGQKRKRAVEDGDEDGQVAKKGGVAAKRTAKAEAKKGAGNKNGGGSTKVADLMNRPYTFPAISAGRSKQ